MNSSNGGLGEADSDANGGAGEMAPRAFISYSWTSPAHQERIRGWADRLLAEGVNVVIDVYDLKEGDDKYAFMERMVADPSVTHVLVFSDCEYAKKADERADGVGAESQIISESIYKAVKQSKFIPIVCERDEQGEAMLPVFMKSRFWLDFSSEHEANASWEKLIRALHGQPLHVKPRLGARPAYLDANADENTAPIKAKFATFTAAIQRQATGIGRYRDEFLDACIAYADRLRVRRPPEEGALGATPLEDCRKLTAVRDALVDWLKLEASTTAETDLSPVLVSVLERLLELKARPPEVTHWNERWFVAQRMFVYETFLYIVAALLQRRRYEVLNELFQTHYILPETDRRGETYARFEAFQDDTSALGNVLTTDGGQRYICPAAELIKRQATRTDFGLHAIIESELLVFTATLADERALWWHPGTLLYSEHGGVPRLFLRAARRADFKNLGRILGVDSADELRRVVRESWQRHERRFSGSSFLSFPNSLLAMMNLEQLGTLR